MKHKGLYSIAKNLQVNPTDLDLFGRFIESLNKESSVEEICKVLNLDYERITGHALIRIAELLPDKDVDLMLCIAFWHYHLGMDEEALKYLHAAKELKPTNLPVLQTEVFLSYGQGAKHVLELCNSALKYSPDDPWLLDIKSGIEITGDLKHMDGPTLRSKWQTALAQ